MAKKRKKSGRPKSVTIEEKIEKELSHREKNHLSMLARCKDEKTEYHRAFLLWAMQTPPNLSKVAKIFSRTTSGIKYWQARFQWERRRPSTDSIAIECQSLYRALYYDTMGESEVKQLGMWLNTPVENVPVNQDIVDKVREIVKQNPADTNSMRDQKIRERHMTAIDASIAYVMAGIKDGSLKRNLRDLPYLIQLREQMMENSNKSGVNALIVESLRVQQAKSNNGNVVDAMYEDAMELCIILKNLRNTGEGHEAIHGEAEETS